jgi:hypothetical protein
MLSNDTLMTFLQSCMTTHHWFENGVRKSICDSWDKRVEWTVW